MPRLLLALALLATSPAMAAPRDLTVQVSNAGLQFIDQEIPKILPSSFAHPGFTEQLLDCPFTSSETQLKVTDVQAKVTVSSITTTTETSGRIRVKLSASASGSLYGAANPCYLSDVKCRFDFSLSGGSASASFIPVVEGNRVKLTSPTIELQIAKDNVGVQASSCGMVGSLINLVLPLLKGWLLDLLVDKVKQILLQSVPPQIESTLSSFTQMSGTLEGFSVTGKLEEATARTDGVLLGIGLSVTTTKTSSCPLASVGAPATVTSSPTFAWQGEQIGLGIARHAVEKALLAAWKAGFFCMNDAAMTAMGLPPTLKGLAGLLFGMSSTKSLEIHAHKAPQISYSPGSDARADLLLPGAEVRLAGEAASGPTVVTARFDLKLSVKLRLDPQTRAITLELASTSLANVKLSATNPTGLTLDPALFDQIVTTTVMPMLETQVNGMELMPQVLRHEGGLLDPYYLYLARGVTTKDHVSIYGRIYRKPASDSTPPTTTLDKKPGALVAPQLFKFVASGSDSQTPEPLLRFAWRLDGGAYSAPSYSQVKTVSLTDGKHTVEVRAVDLLGNQDGTPAAASFEVDGVRPTLQVTDAPKGTISAAEATIKFVASDNRTAAGQIGVSVRVEHRSGAAGEYTKIKDDPFATGLDQVSLSGLYDGEHKVTLIARDEAGNVSEPATVSFQVTGVGAAPPPPPTETPADNAGLDETSGLIESGCSVSGTLPASDLASILLLLGLALMLRRR